MLYPADAFTYFNCSLLGNFATNCYFYQKFSEDN